ncbi:hypothetical protein ACFHYQ_13935 [Sphaerimonospora cavernae]|uniref:Uncharacterized protein n=1 Tax=Sphaerimonospora cavernae TaxID=1740611 RepID=A0ABV6U665_9ACTN
MTDELIAGYANYASTEAILQEQQNAAVQHEQALLSITLTFTITITVTI